MNPLFLRFDDPETEREFRAAFDSASVPNSRVAAVLGIVLYGVFAILDAQTAADGLTELLVMRTVVICLIGLGLALSFRPWFHRVQQVVVCGTVLVAGLGMASMQVIATVPEGMAAMGVMLTLMFLFAFIRARFVAALITAGLMVAGYEVALFASEFRHATIVYLNFELLAFAVIGVFAGHTLERLRRRDFLRGRELEFERQRSDALLYNVLPKTIAQRLRLDPSAGAEAADDVTVLFLDIAGFTALTERNEPALIVAVLDRLFARFDDLCDEFAVEKVKTIGDGYMAVAGIPDAHPDAAAAIADLALGMRAVAAGTGMGEFGPLAVRIGICTGPVLAGVIGRRRFAYDLWGDTVNTASRLESHGEPGVIQVCQRTRDLLADRFEFDGPRMVDLKGKGPFEAWQLQARVVAYAAMA